MFNEIISSTGIVDQKGIMLSDIDFEFIVTKSGSKKNDMDPERWLIRYQFMEIFVRIALHKYHKSKLVESQYEAVEMLWNDHLLPFFSKYDCHKWRLDNLWNNECDDVLIKYNSILKKLFDKYSGKYTKPSKLKFVSIDEFITMVSDSGALRYEVGHGSSMIGSQFNLAMMTHVDEITKDNHIKMFFIEFLEAVCRVAHKIKIFPNIDRYNMKYEDLRATPVKPKPAEKHDSSDSLDDMYNNDSDFEDVKTPEIERNATNLKPSPIVNKVKSSLIINVDGEPLYLKLEIFIKL